MPSHLRSVTNDCLDNEVLNLDMLPGTCYISSIRTSSRSPTNSQRVVEEEPGVSSPRAYAKHSNVQVYHAEGTYHKRTTGRRTPREKQLQRQREIPSAPREEVKAI